MQAKQYSDSEFRDNFIMYEIVKILQVEKGISKTEWADKEEWKRKNKIKTLATERCENIETLYIKKPFKFRSFIYG